MIRLDPLRMGARGRGAGDADGLRRSETPDRRRPRRTEEPARRSLLDTLIDGGIVGLLIGLLSVVSLGFIIEHSMSIRKSTLIPEDVADELETLIQEGKIDEAIEACEDPNNESLIADVVLAGLRRYQASEFGFAEYKAAVEEAGEDQTGRLYRKTEVLGVIGAIAPMLGLDRYGVGHDRSVQQDRRHRRHRSS